MLWIEDVDYICKQKDLFYGFLNELDRYSGLALVIATTNKMSDLDKGLRRGGRLDLDIRLDMPSDQDRFNILKVHLKNLEGVPDDELKIMARAASGFVSSDLAQIVRNAQLLMIKAGDTQIGKVHLEASILEAKPLSI